MLLLGLYADDAFARADGFHGQLHAAHDFGGAFLHDDCVLMQKRFAFRAVGDDGFGPGAELDVRGKPSAPRAHDAGLPNFFRQIHF